MADPAFLSNTVMGIQVETTRGTAPTTGTYNAIPFLDGVSFGTEKEVATSDVYDGTRTKTLTVGGSQAVRLRLNTRFNYEAGQKDLIRFGLHSADWAAGVVTLNANASYFFTLAVKLELGATDDYHIFTGCEVASMTINMPLNDQSTISYEILGMARTISTALPGSATFGALTGKDPFRTVLVGSTPTWGGTNLIGAENASLTITNQATPKYAWGGTAADHIVNGNARVDGSMGVYYRSADLAEDTDADTLRALTFVLKNNETAGEDTITINMPNTRLVNSPVSDSAQSMMQSVDFAAQYSASITSILNMTVA